MTRNAILILGATSPIARAAATAFARKGYPIYLAGRDLAELQRIATDIAIRCRTTVSYGYFDAEAFGSHDKFLNDAIDHCGALSGALLAFGTLGDQEQAPTQFDMANKIITCNFTAACSILTHCANYFSKKKEGFIIALSSVAGDRGRQSNYVYGAAKGGLTLFLQGLRNRLHPYGVRVITIKPGFVDTSMTYGKPGMFLVASPESVGRKIAASLDSKRDVVYIPGFWKYIMHIIKAIPEGIFKKMKL